jgi:predicted phosphodiesterase
MDKRRENPVVGEPQSRHLRSPEVNHQFIPEEDEKIKSIKHSECKVFFPNLRRDEVWARHLQLKGEEMKPNLEEILQSKNISEKELLHLLEGREKRQLVIQRRTKSKLVLGIVGDTHMIDKADAVSELADFYRICAERKVEAVLHAGDMLAGLGSVYPGQMADLQKFGIDDHLKYFGEKYPKAAFKTYFISGNHDMNYKSVAGLNIGQKITELRPELVFLGDYDGSLTLNGVKIELHHGHAGMPYSVSYHLQKFIEKIGAGKKPQIYILGHYHTSLYMFYRNIHCFLPGCFQKPNDFSVRRGLPNMIGGWIVEMDVADDRHNSIISLKMEFVPYYE